MDTETPPTIIKTGNITLDLSTKRVDVNGKAIHLTRSEYEVFALLAESKGLICTEDDLKLHIYGIGMTNKHRGIIKVFVAHIREKIKVAGGANYIETIRSAGYRLTDEVQEVRIPCKPVQGK